MATAYAVNSIESVTLGGAEQWVWIRGASLRNPILLVLHGGPGSANIGLVGGRMALAEQAFTVVDWDQRGSGKSYSAKLPRSSMNIEQIASDAAELIAWLLRRFGHPKLFILGHSWGSAVGMRVARDHPEAIYAYIGVGQVVNALSNDTVSYEFTLAAAKAAGQAKAVADLERLGPPPWPMRRALIQRRWLQKLGGGVSPEAALPIGKLLRHRQYSLSDWVRFVKGKLYSLDTLWDSYQAIDLPTQVPSVDVPVHLLLGRRDFNTPSASAQAYLESLVAPSKELVWFENSGHAPMYEEPEAFAGALAGIAARYPGATCDNDEFTAPASLL